MRVATPFIVSAPVTFPSCFAICSAATADRESGRTAGAAGIGEGPSIPHVGLQIVERTDQRIVDHGLRPVTVDGLCPFSSAGHRDNFGDAVGLRPQTYTRGPPST